MTKILVVAEHSNGRLNPAVARAVSCAVQIGGSIDIAVLAAEGAAVSAEAAGLEGVTGVVTLERSENEHPLAAIIAPQIASIASVYSYVLVASTTFGKDVAPRVAALIGVGQVSDLSAVDGAYAFRRPIYAGNAVVSLAVPTDAVVVATVRAASFAEAGRQDTPAPITAIRADVELPTHTRFVELRSGKSDRPDLQSAKTVVSGGRALGSSEGFEIIYRLADAMGAAVGASRAAVDAGYVPNEMQVGQTGKIIAPNLYVAIGISGAIQHLTGIKDAGTIVAINSDASAPIFEIADIGLVGDLFQIVPQLTEQLS